MSKKLPNNVRAITLPTFTKNKQTGKKQGTLSIIQDAPFKIKRAYWIYDLGDNSIRGGHAHKETEQILICLNGSCEVEVDDGKQKETIIMDDPRIGIYTGKLLWHTLKNFKDNAIILVLASGRYLESDYIRDYEEFRNYIK